MRSASSSPCSAREPLPQPVGQVGAHRGRQRLAAARRGCARARSVVDQVLATRARGEARAGAAAPRREARAAPTSPPPPRASACGAAPRTPTRRRTRGPAGRDCDARGSSATAAGRRDRRIAALREPACRVREQRPREPHGRQPKRAPPPARGACRPWPPTRCAPENSPSSAASQISMRSAFLGAHELERRTRPRESLSARGRRCCRAGAKCRARRRRWRLTGLSPSAAKSENASMNESRSCASAGIGCVSRSPL